jgi:uncharacterized membrane protein
MNVFFEFLWTMLIALGASALTYIVARRLSGATSPQSAQRGAALGYHLTDRLFLIVVGVYGIVFGGLAILRYLALDSGMDLAQYDQLVWNSLNGRLLENTFIYDAPFFLGKSFTPILLALVPLYALAPGPIVLLVLQTIALASAAFPIYWFARERLGAALALAVGMAYFLSPIVGSVSLTDFHEIALAAPALAFATFFLLRQHYRGLYVCLGVALLIKEELGFAVIAFGVYIFLVQRKRWLGLALALFGVLWVVLLLQYVIPFFYAGKAGSAFYYLGGGKYGGGTSRYGYLGSSLAQVLITLVTRPELILEHLSIPAKIEFVVHFFVPLAFLPLFGIEVFALALPAFGYTILSDYAAQFSIWQAYTPPLFPFAFFAAIVGVARVRRWNFSVRASRQTASADDRPRVAALVALILVASSVSYYLQSPGPLARRFSLAPYLSDAHTMLGHSLAAKIPRDATLVVQTNLLTLLSNRRQIYEIPIIPDYRQADYLFCDMTHLYYYVHKEYWESYWASGFFQPVMQQDGYVIARRRDPANTLNIQYGDQLTLLGSSMIITETSPWGTTLRPVLEWRADKPITDTYRIMLRVVDRLGHEWAVEDREPLDGLLPTNRWTAGKPVSDQFTLKLPPTMPGGEYQVMVAVPSARAEGGLIARDAQGQPLGDEAEIATVQIAKNKKPFAASEVHIVQRLAVDMGELRFIGYVPPRETIAPGELLQVGVYWRARAKPRGDYVVAVQLRDATGRVAFEQSSRPANGTYPTTLWDAGEVLLDWHDFDLPRDLPVGRYQIFALLRDAATGVRVGETLISTISVVK